MLHHPHIHCIVSGGGSNSIGKWAKVLHPVKVLSRKFRENLLFYNKQSRREGQLEFFGDDRYLLNESSNNRIIGMENGKVAQMTGLQGRQPEADGQPQQNEEATSM